MNRSSKEKSRAAPQRQAVLCGLILVAGLSAVAFGQPVPLGIVAVSGTVDNQRQLTPAELRALPATEVSIDFKTDRGEEKASYRGPLLLDVLVKAGITDAGGKDAHIRHAILVTGRDGYTVALAIGEVDPKFEGKLVILATEKNGQPLDLEQGPRLIVPGDRHGGRAVKDVDAIVVN